MLSGSAIPLAKQRIVSKDPEVLKAIRYVSIGHIIGLHSPMRKSNETVVVPTPTNNGTTTTNGTATASTSPAASVAPAAASNAPKASALPSVAASTAPRASVTPAAAAASASPKASPAASAAASADPSVVPPPKVMNFREQTLSALSGGGSAAPKTPSPPKAGGKIVIGPAAIFETDILSGPWDFVTINYADMSAELTAQIHSVNKKVHILTLPDDIVQVENILRYGADGIITKYLSNIQKAWYFVSRDGALPFVN